MNTTTGDTYTLLFVADQNASLWCAPAIGAFAGCSAQFVREVVIHNWIIGSINLLCAALVLGFFLWRGTYLTRIYRERSRRADTIFIVGASCIFNTIFNALWCFLRQPDGRVPPWLVASMFSLSAATLLPSLNYIFVFFRDLVQSQTIRARLGLLPFYRRLWIVQTAACTAIFILYPIAAIEPRSCYPILGRLFFVLFAAYAAWMCSLGGYYGLKLARHDSTPTSVRRSILQMSLALLAMAVPGVPLIALAGISPHLFDRVPVMWHLFYGFMELPMTSFSAIISKWSWDTSLALMETRTTVSKASVSSDSLENETTTTTTSQQQQHQHQ